MYVFDNSDETKFIFHRAKMGSHIDAAVNEVTFKRNGSFEPITKEIVEQYGGTYYEKKYDDLFAGAAPAVEYRVKFPNPDFIM